MLGFFKSRLPRKLVALQSDATKLVEEATLLQDYNARVITSNEMIIERIQVRNVDLLDESAGAQKLKVGLTG